MWVAAPPPPLLLGIVFRNHKRVVSVKLCPSTGLDLKKNVEATFKDVSTPDVKENGPGLWWAVQVSEW